MTDSDNINSKSTGFNCSLRVGKSYFFAVRWFDTKLEILEDRIEITRSLADKIVLRKADIDSIKTGGFWSVGLRIKHHAQDLSPYILINRAYAIKNQPLIDALKQSGYPVIK